MKKINFIQIIGALLLAILISSSCNKEEATDETLSNLDKALGEAMAQYDIPSLSVAIVHKEKLVYIQSYGLSDKETSYSCLKR